MDKSGSWHSLRRVAGCGLVLVAAALIAGCTAVPTDPVTQGRYDVLMERGAEHIEVKDPTTALYMSFLFGGGNFYLGQTPLGIVNLLFWPLSIVWAAPQCQAQAHQDNIRATVEYYDHGPGVGEFPAETGP